MRSLLVLIIILGSLPFILLKPHVGILMWFWVSFMSPHRISWGVTDALPLALIVAAATLAGMLISRESKRFPVTPLSVLLVVYTIWICITTVFAVNPDDAHDLLDRALKILVMTFVTMMLINTRERIHMLIWVAVISIGIYGVNGGIFTILTGGNYRVWGPPESFLADNNSLALALAMVLPFMRYLQLNSSYKMVRWGITGAMVCTLLAILGTYSRGGLLGLCATIAALTWKSRRRFVILLAAMPVVVVALMLAPQHWWDRMQSIGTYDEDESAQGRLNAWGLGLKIAQDRPIVGGGFGVYWSNDVWEKYEPNLNADFYGKAAHSIYFDSLGEHGPVGLFLFVAIGLVGFLTGTWIIKHTRDRPDLIWARDLAAMTQVSFVAYAAAGTFLSLAMFDFYYFGLAILVVTKQVVVQSLEYEHTQGSPKLAPVTGPVR